MRRHPGAVGHPQALREQATAMRHEGIGRASIARALDVGASTVARWFREDGVEMVTASGGGRAAWLAAHHRTIEERWAHQQAEQDSHRDSVGALTDRELLLIGAGLYWAEGSKAKLWRRAHVVTFMNSDPSMIRVFLAYLRVLGVPRNTWRCHVSIHESADIEAAVAFWRTVVGEDVLFHRPTIKRHKPVTVRYNSGDDYHGCLAVRLVGGATVYRRIAGSWDGIAAAVDAGVAHSW